MTHLERLRRQCEPTQEDTPVAPREHRVTIDRRDLLQLLADYDKLQTDYDRLIDAYDVLASACND